MTGDWNAMRSADLNSCRCVGDKTYLVGKSVAGPWAEDKLYSPTRSVVLQVLAFPLQHTASDFNGCRMIFSRIHDVRDLPNWDSWIDHLTVIRGKFIPFMVLHHCKRALLQLLCRVIVFVSLAAEDACQNIVCFLNFANNNGFQFTAGSFEVEICL
jgi:hypothetical protein